MARVVLRRADAIKVAAWLSDKRDYVAQATASQVAADVKRDLKIDVLSRAIVRLCQDLGLKPPNRVGEFVGRAERVRDIRKKIEERLAKLETAAAEGNLPPGQVVSMEFADELARRLAQVEISLGEMRGKHLAQLGTFAQKLQKLDARVVQVATDVTEVYLRIEQMKEIARKNWLDTTEQFSRTISSIETKKDNAEARVNQFDHQLTLLQQSFAGLCKDFGVRPEDYLNK